MHSYSSLRHHQTVARVPVVGAPAHDMPGEFAKRNVKRRRQFGACGKRKGSVPVPHESEVHGCWNGTVGIDSLPDPYLVAVKAAANWFAGQNQRMLADASVYDSEHSDTDSECNDVHTSPLQGPADPLENLRRSLSSGMHVQVEPYSAN